MHSATVIVRMTPQQKDRLGLLAAGSGMSSWIRDRIDAAVGPSADADADTRVAAQSIDLRVSQALSWVERRIAEIDAA
jgi:hypothetical protein